MPHGDADKGIHTPKSTFYDQGRFGRLLPGAAGVRGRHAERARGPRRARQARRSHGREGEPDRRPVRADRGPDPRADEPRQPPAHGRHDVPRAVPRPRHDVRPDVEPGPCPGPGVDPQLPDPALDLDSVYGGGPGASPHLYDQTVDHGRTTMLTEPTPAPRPSASTTTSGSTSRATPADRAHRGSAQRREPAS